MGQLKNIENSDIATGKFSFNGKPQPEKQYQEEDTYKADAKKINVKKLEKNKIKKLKINLKYSKAAGSYTFSKDALQASLCYTAKKSKSNMVGNKVITPKKCVDFDAGPGYYKISSAAASYNTDTDKCMVQYDDCKNSEFLNEIHCVTIPAICNTVNGCIKLIGNTKYGKLGTITTEAKKCSDYGKDYFCSKEACVQNKCGDGYLYEEEECDDGNAKNGDGCSNKCKIEEGKVDVDLYVGKIFDYALSDKCINSYFFEVCNKGPSAIAKDFDINVGANEIAKEMKFSENTYPNASKIIEAGKCVNFTVGQKLHILAFDVPLQTSKTVSVTVDSADEIAETDETNNDKQGSVYSGDDYYFDEKTICESFCYDNDSGKDYWNEGKIIGKYKDEMWIKEDACYDGQKVGLKEYFCKEVYKLDNGMLANPLGDQSIDCRLLGGKCDNGKCVPAENKLKCIGKSLEETNIWSKSSIDYTSIEGEKSVLEDICRDDVSDLVKEFFCESDQEMYGYTEVSCYNTNAICEDGACKKIEKITCEDSDNKDYYKAGYAKQTVTLDDGTKKEKITADSCMYYADKVVEQYCDGTKMGNTDYDCSADSASCIVEYNEDIKMDMGRCSLPDDSLKKCEETDAGLDYYNSGAVEFTTKFGESGKNSDYCNNDSDVLIEFYCKNKEIIMDNHDCSGEGKVCYDGTCITPVENYYCNETDGGNNPLVGSALSGINIDGSNINNWDWCNEYGMLFEYYCENGLVKLESHDCSSLGKVCVATSKDNKEIGACEEPTTSSS